jgi:hypothetical protein
MVVCFGSGIVPAAEREKMGMRSREYAMAHLTREVNLSLVINSIKQILQ